MGKSRVVFQFLQMLSSILGGLYMVYFVLKMPTHYHTRKKPTYKYWFFAFLFSFFVIYIRDCNTIQKFIATSISGGLLGLIFSASLTQIITIFQKY